MMSVSMPGQNWVRISEIVVANRSRPSGSWSATLLAPEERMRWIVLGISKL
jgi:hypothetical protein